ncbi:MAG: 5'/3'-nucleotidase SurE [Clostridiales bacterium]|jgi:5'-nucleotidase|nr:5'/3'-nucleotidase SurE [Clostridiales bacterium]
MKILLTNDDGIRAPGLHCLCRYLSKIAKVFVVAPLWEQSCTGHSITYGRPLRLHKAEVPFSEEAWAAGGFPADCVKLGLEHVLDFKPDLVVSGINSGANLGTDIIYSGTVSGALEGQVYDLPSLAVSLIKEGENMTAAALFVRDFCLAWQKQSFRPCTTFNINVPPGPIKGAKYCHMGRRTYTNVFDIRTDPKGELYFWLQGDIEADDLTGDVQVTADGFISVTPLWLDLTDYRLLEGGSLPQILF